MNTVVKNSTKESSGVRKLGGFILEKQREKDVLMAKLSKLDIEIQVLKELDPLQEIESSNLTETIYDNDRSDWLLDEPTTLKIISKSKDPNGLGIQDIKKQYIESGYNCHDRHVDKHLKNLLASGKVVQTNPGITKGRRFRVSIN